ncbi:MAG: C4-type zinc ribbon domain-containing protein [Acidimicrobiales bacterium]
MSRWDVLLAVQEHDTHLDQLAHRYKTMSQRADLADVMAQIVKVDARVAEVETERHALGKSQQRLEDDITSINDKATLHDKALYSGTIGNPRELQVMQDEIASLKRRVSQLEDQELELMEQIEPLDAELARLAAERIALDERGSGLRGEIAEAEVAIEAEQTSLRVERDSLMSGVEPELQAEYEELRPQFGGVAIARFVGGSCGGCHLSLSAMEVDRIKKLPSEQPAHCEECGRLLAR